MSGGDEWSRLARRAQADQRAARRRGSGRGRAQPDRPGMLRAVTSNRQPDRQPTGLAPTPTKEANEMTNDDRTDDQPEASSDEQADQLLAEQAARHREIDTLIADARAEAEQAVRDLPISPFEWAARKFEQQPGPDLSDRPQSPDLSNRPQ